MIKSKNYDWTKIPYFQNILKEFKFSSNIIILNDPYNWTPTNCLTNTNFGIAKMSSLADEMLVLNKPIIIVGHIVTKSHGSRYELVKLLEKICGDIGDQWGTWKDPFENAINVFKHNPYVDDFVDSVGDEIFHDHYRVYDKNCADIPLVEQMLDFWQFTPEEYEDSSPELYFTDEEK